MPILLLTGSCKGEHSLHNLCYETYLVASLSMTRKDRHSFISLQLMICVSINAYGTVHATNLEKRVYIKVIIIVIKPHRVKSTFSYEWSGQFTFQI